MNKDNCIILGLLFYLALFCASCAGTHGKIKSYEFAYSKLEVNKAIKSFIANAPQYKVPDNYYSYTWHYGGDSTIDNEWIQQANADSVSFSFYFPDENIVIWCSFFSRADDWHSPSCTLALIGYIKPNETKWKFNADISSREKREITNKLERLILNNVPDELNKNGSISK